MEPKLSLIPPCLTLKLWALVLMVLWCSISCVVRADVNQDKQKCADQLVGLVGCLPYVSGDPTAKSPTVDCCTGLKVVLKKSQECLCILVKDRNDPSLSSYNINVTLALGLPDKCQTPANISECPDLLHLPSNSPDAQVFYEFGNKTGSGNVTSTLPPQSGSSPTTTTTESNKNEGGKTIGWLRIEKMVGMMIIVALHVLPNH